MTEFVDHTQVLHTPLSRSGRIVLNRFGIAVTECSTGEVAEALLVYVNTAAPIMTQAVREHYTDMDGDVDAAVARLKKRHVTLGSAFLVAKDNWHKSHLPRSKEFWRRVQARL